MKEAVEWALCMLGRKGDIQEHNNALFVDVLTIQRLSLKRPWNMRPPRVFKIQPLPRTHRFYLKYDLRPRAMYQASVQAVWYGTT